MAALRGLGGNLLSATSLAVDTSSLQELTTANRGGDGLRFQAGAPLAFPFRWHLATQDMKVAGLPIWLYKSCCFHLEKRLLSSEENFLQMVLVSPYNMNQYFPELSVVLFTSLQPGTAAQAQRLRSGQVPFCGAWRISLLTVQDMRERGKPGAHTQKQKMIIFDTEIDTKNHQRFPVMPFYSPFQNTCLY